MAKRIPAVIRKHHGPLKMMSKATKRNFNIILNTTPQIAHAIQALFKLILDRNGPMEENHIKKLKKHKHFIRKIAYNSHKRVIPDIQKGGSIFKTILSVALPFLSTLL